MPTLSSRGLPVGLGGRRSEGSVCLARVVVCAATAPTAADPVGGGAEVVAAETTAGGTVWAVAPAAVVPVGGGATGAEVTVGGTVRAVAPAAAAPVDGGAAGAEVPVAGGATRIRGSRRTGLDTGVSIACTNDRMTRGRASPVTCVTGFAASCTTADVAAAVLGEVRKDTCTRGEPRACAVVSTAAGGVVKKVRAGACGGTVLWT